MAFAASLAKIVVQKKEQLSERSVVAQKWLSHEAALLDEAVKLFRQRCTREAKQRKCQLTASFEVLSRDIAGFPSHVVKASTYVVNAWGEGVDAEAWFYSKNGTNGSFSPGAPVLFAEMLEGMMPKFLDRVQRLGFKTACREAGTWKVTVTWKAPNGDAKDSGSFADELTKLVAEQAEEDKARQEMGKKWLAYEAKLIAEATDIFKQRCTREAEQSRLEASISFEVLSREIPDFPKRVVRDANYFVAAWGGAVTAEAWFYSTHGPSATFSQDDAVLFAEVLECMMPKFVEHLQMLGFKTCRREAGTWKVAVSWKDPDQEEPSSKKHKNGSSA